MDDCSTKAASGKSLRPVRNRRYSRRAFGSGHRPAKRLFTPEIKRYLKEWLIRRRENPYPNREEKKFLAVETGLTYIQICNWFANWRRKLKNVGNEHHRKTWGHLIKTYNDQAHGNVEQFSICSDDSIWGEADLRSTLVEDTYDDGSCSPYESDEYDDSISTYIQNGKEFIRENKEEIQQCYHVSSTTEDSKINPMISSNNNKILYKFNDIDMRYVESEKSSPEKTTIEDPTSENLKTKMSGPLLLSKWMESAAKFQPKENNYACWTGGGVVSSASGSGTAKSRNKVDTFRAVAARHGHGQEEVEAAVALTALASSSHSFVT